MSADPMSPQLTAHKLVAQTVMELGKHGIDPRSIRAALALNLVLACRVDHPHGDQGALLDVQAVLSNPPRRADGA
jgi:hypothetical protein